MAKKPTMLPVAAALAASLSPTLAAEAAMHLCKGVLMDQRVVGVSLGDCDLNELSDQEFKRVTSACGEPNGVGEDRNQTQCTVRAFVKPKPGYPGVNIVKRLLGVTASRRESN